MINKNVNSREFQQLAQLAASEILHEMNTGNKGFKNIRKIMLAFNHEFYGGQVRASKCFELCKNVFYDKGLDGLEQILTGEVNYQDCLTHLSPLPQRIVDHKVPDAWRVMIIPARENEEKTYRLFINWYEVDKYYVTSAALDNTLVENHKAYYIWREANGRSFALLKSSSYLLSETAEQAFQQEFVEPFFDSINGFSFYTPDSMKYFMVPKHERDEK